MPQEKEKKLNSLIVGYGEIGKSLEGVLAPYYNISIAEIGVTPDKQDFDVMHICFPYSKDFVKEVKNYQFIFQPKLTVIHSTVPLGTTVECLAYHSPVRGMHPDLTKSMKTFVTYLAPKHEGLKDYFEKAGMKIKLIANPNETELGKILSTTYYGWNLIFEKEVHRICEELNLDFDTVYEEFNNTYNQGYKTLGIDNVIRPVFKHMDGKIGGHCIIPNCSFLDTFLTRTIRKQNKKY